MATLKDTNVHFLKLVDNSVGDESELPIVVDVKTGEQRTLFAVRTHRVAIFVNTSTIGDYDFKNVVEATAEGTVLDVRVAPRFDIGSLNRGKAFGLFETHRVSYVDYCGASGIRAPDDEKLQAATIAIAIKQSLVGRKNADRPLCLLLDGYQLSDEFIASFMRSFADEAVEWDVLVVPQPRVSDLAAANADRRLIFISHAAPEDNAFAAWLAARLKVAGYEPWLDLSELRSGEAFWSGIESAIKDRSAVVLAVTSLASRAKEGVLTEIHLASSLERARGAKGFIIPIKLDGISAIDMPIQLQRRQYIDFSRGWAEGLRRVLKELDSRKISGRQSAKTDFSTWFDRSLTMRSRIGNEPESLVCNWLPISKLPAEIFLHEAPVGTSVVELAKRYGESNPLVVDGRWCTFAEIQDTGEDSSALFRSSPTTRYKVQNWLEEENVSPPCGKKGVRRGRFVDLLRRSLEKKMAGRSLRAFQLSNKKLAWFFEHEALENDRVMWVDAKGKTRRKNLVGFSPTKSVYWHLAIELKPTLWPNPIVVVKLHVVFSTNGRSPLGDAAKMHALRRRFCKSWWNENWRDLLLAAIFELSDGTHQLFGDDTDELIVSSVPVAVTAPFSVLSADAIEEESIEVEEQLADDEEWINEDFEEPSPFETRE